MMNIYRRIEDVKRRRAGDKGKGIGALDLPIQRERWDVGRGRARDRGKG
jgi:hypothetical protein